MAELIDIMDLNKIPEGNKEFIKMLKSRYSISDINTLKNLINHKIDNLKEELKDMIDFQLYQSGKVDFSKDITYINSKLEEERLQVLSNIITHLMDEIIQDLQIQVKSK